MQFQKLHNGMILTRLGGGCHFVTFPWPARLGGQPVHVPHWDLPSPLPALGHGGAACVPLLLFSPSSRV